MRAFGLMISIIAIVVLGGSSPTAIASQTVAFQIHEIPDDPNSPIVFGITLKVQEADRDGDWIGWEIVHARFERHGESAATWTKNAPFVATSDGLWWIQHADAEHPAIEEFVQPPQLAGAAEAQGQMHDDLNFMFKGRFYDPELRGSPYSVTGALDYTFMLANEAEPLEEGEDGPVQVESDFGT